MTLTLIIGFSLLRIECDFRDSSPLSVARGSMAAVTGIFRSVDTPMVATVTASM
jgi:hypothetical protein